LDAFENFFPAFNGGNLTINALTVNFNSDGIAGPVNFNGGDGSSTFNPGSGGSLTVATLSSITVDTPIEAMSGLIEPGNTNPSGSGGGVSLSSTAGTVTVNDRIQVTAAQPTSTIAPFRQSASGGQISIQSAKSSGVAIDIANSAQLLGDVFSPDSSGSIINLLATGASSEIDAKGTINANHGSIDIRHTGANGQISLGGINPDFVSMHADVIKIGALGSNGVLTIGSGMLNADTTLKLYAGGSNGTINFVADVTLNGNSTKIIAANTINIFDDVTLTIHGTVPAKLYTNNPNFSSDSGGNDVHQGLIVSDVPHEIHPFDANTPPFDDPTRPANAPSDKSATAKASPTPSQTTVAPSNSNGNSRRGPKPPIVNPAVATNQSGNPVNVTDTNQIIQMLDNPNGTAAIADEPAARGRQKNGRHRGRKGERQHVDRDPRLNNPRMDRGRLPTP
jgi:hypothetical protein